MDAEKTCVVSLAWTVFFLPAYPNPAPFSTPVSSSASFITISLTPAPIYLLKYSCAQTQHTECTLTYVISVVSLRAGAGFVCLCVRRLHMPSTGLGTETAVNKLLLTNW